MKLFCEVLSNPVANNIDYLWKFNGKRIHVGKVLSKRNISYFDSGIYECIVNHIANLASKSITINIDCKFSKSFIHFFIEITLPSSKCLECFYVIFDALFDEEII